MKRAPKPLKFWHQLMTEVGGQGAYSRYLSSHAKKIFCDAAEVRVCGMKARSYRGHAPGKALENASVYESCDCVLEQVIDNVVATLQKIACPTLNLWPSAPPKG